jgi:CheY-like chemotaxis protein
MVFTHSLALRTFRSATGIAHFHHALKPGITVGEFFGRSNLCLVLRSRTGWTVCGEARDGKDALEKAVELKPDVILLDLSMPHQGPWLISHTNPEFADMS